VKQQHPGFAAAEERLEERFAEAFEGVDCGSYMHEDLCYYLLELVHEDLKSGRRLRDLQRLLEAVAAAVEELAGGRG
jgi:hypothetical protein